MTQTREEAIADCARMGLDPLTGGPSIVSLCQPQDDVMATLIRRLNRLAIARILKVVGTAEPLKPA